MHPDDLNRLATRLCVAYLDRDRTDWNEDVVASIAMVTPDEAMAAIRWMALPPRKWCQVGAADEIGAINSTHIGAMRGFLRPSGVQQAMRVVAHAILWGSKEDDDALDGVVTRSALPESAVVTALTKLKEESQSRFLSLDGTGTRLLLTGDDVTFLESFVYSHYLHEAPPRMDSKATVIVTNHGQMGGVTGQGNVGATTITTVTYRQLLEEVATQLEKPEAPSGSAAIAKTVRETIAKHGTEKAMDALIPMLPGIAHFVQSVASQL